MNPVQPPMSDEAFQLVMLERTERIDASIQQALRDVANVRAESVPRTEWVQRNNLVDERFQGQGREIGDLKRAEAARRTPWDRILTAVVSVVALALVIIFQYAN
jgi:hypothetical protein